jgi:hypothetical protein
MFGNDISMPRCAALCVVGSLVLLGGCSDNNLARTFGLVRDAPDEFTVTTQPPLSMPPDYNLRPPRPGVLRPQLRPESVQAEEALSPQLALGGPTSPGLSAGQQALIQETGPSTSRNIRQLVDEDARLAQANEGFLDRILTWRKPDTIGVEVEPEGESQRLRQAAALGQSTNTGATPTITPKRRNFFQRLFD